MEQFEKKWNILRKIWLLKKWYVWEKAGYFWEKKCILPFNYFSIRPFPLQLGPFEKMEHFDKKPGIFEKNPGTGSNQNSGRALCGKPYRSSPPFCAPQQAWKLLRNFCSNFGWDFTYTHKCHWPAKHQHSNQVQSDSLPSVSGDVTRGTQKMLKNGFCKRHLVKWQVASGSLKKVYLSQIFSNVSQKKIRKHFLSDFWGMLKTPLI